MSWAEEGDAAIDGNFTAKIDNNGMLHFTLKTDFLSFGKNGEELVFYKRDTYIIPMEVHHHLQ